MKDDVKISRTLWATGYIAHRHFTAHMTRLMRATGMDCQLILVWGWVFNLGVAHLFPPGEFDASTLDDKGFAKDGIRPVRLADLAQVMGLPKETVRRKLQQLARAGHVKKNRDATWVCIPNSSDTASREAAEENIRQLLIAARQIEAILAKV